MSQALPPRLVFRPALLIPPTSQQAFNALDGTLRFINDEDLRQLIVWHLVSYQFQELPSTHVQLSGHVTLQETFDAYQVVYRYITDQIDALLFSDRNSDLVNIMDTLLCLMNAHIRSRCHAGDFSLTFERPPLYNTSVSEWLAQSGRSPRDALHGLFCYITNTELRFSIIEGLCPSSSLEVRAFILRKVSTEQPVAPKEA